MHVAFGASAGIGGTVSVPVHLDCLILEPTLEIGWKSRARAGTLGAVRRTARILLLAVALLALGAAVAYAGPGGGTSGFGGGGGGGGGFSGGGGSSGGGYSGGGGSGTSTGGGVAFLIFVGS